MVVAARADLALCALPVVSRDKVQQLRRETDARGVGGLRALGAVEELLRLSEAIALAVAGTDLALGPVDVAVWKGRGRIALDNLKFKN